MRLWSRLGSLVRKLQRRGVLRAAAVYAVTAWIAVQVAAATFPALPLPPWAHTLVVVLAIFGLPVVVAVAWAYEITPEGIQRTVEEEQPPEIIRARGTPWVALMLVGVVTGASAGLGWTAWDVWLSPGMEAATAGTDSTSGDGEPLPRTRVAVLPYEPGSATDSTGPVADGLAYELNTALDRIAEGTALDVVSHWGVEPYRDTGVPRDSIARALDAGSLVTVAARTIGDSLEVTLQLLDSRTFTSDWTGTFRASRDSLLSLKEIVLTETVRELRRALGEELQTEEIERETDSDESLTLFYRAKSQMKSARELRLAGQRNVAAARYRRADSLLAEAERLDADWVDPTIERGWLALDRAQLPGRTLADIDGDRLRAGIEHANRVLEDEPGHPGALELRGALLNALAPLPGFADSAAAMRSRAIDDLQRAVGQDDDRARAWAELSDAYRRDARFEDAQTAARLARSADPFLINEALYLRKALQVALDLGQVERALDLAERGRDRFPGNAWWDAARLVALSAAGAPSVPPDSVWRVLRRYESLRGREDPIARMQVAAVLARHGLADSARVVLERSKGSVGERVRPYAWYYEANVRLHLGERERAFRLLERYLQAFPDESAYVARDAYWEPVRGDPAFRAVVTGAR